jgi:glycosyltransferase involved in cell wall biosynthesis
MPHPRNRALVPRADPSGGPTGPAVRMFVYNACVTDARVIRESRALVIAGYSVEIVALLDNHTSREEIRDGVRIVRIDRRPLHYRLLHVERGLRRRVVRARRIARRLLTRRRERVVDDSTTAAPLVRPSTTGLQARPTRFRRMIMRFHKPLMYADYYARAYRLARRAPAGINHAHDLNTLPVAALLTRVTGARTVYDSHELFTEISTLSAGERRVWQVIERILIRRVDRTMTVCDSIAEELAKRYAGPAPSVLLNVPDTRGMPPPRRSELLRDRAGLRIDDGPILLYHGGFVPHRGLIDLVVASAHLERGAIVLMGWGRLEAELRLAIDAEGVGDRVRILPPVPPQDLITVAASADVGLIPYEPYGLNNLYSTPNKLFEYMSAGLPIAASRLPELTRFIQSHDMGVTFAPSDPLDMARVLNKLLASPVERGRMAENAREAAQLYSWTRERAKLLQVYAELSGAPGARSGRRRSKVAPVPAVPS